MTDDNDFLFEEVSKDLQDQGNVDLSKLGLKRKKSLGSVLKDIKHKKVEDVGGRSVIVVLLDGSGSMEDVMEPQHSSDSKIEVAWRLLKDQLAPNLSKLACGIIIFPGAIDLNSFLNYQQAYWGLVPTQDMTGFINSGIPTANGGTPMMFALNMAWEWIKNNADLARIIVMSDGLPNDKLPIVILSEAGKHTDVPIDTVGIGVTGKTSDYDPEFLKELSRLTGGKFYEAKSIKQLANVILELSPKNRPLLGVVNHQLGEGKPWRS